MATAPSGTVTFLFTDIEGSTRLAQQYPESMPVLLARHHQILHDRIHANHGYAFQVVGDSFAAAFDSAENAARAAIEAQRDLQSEAWSPAPVRVRMGLHTGAAELNPAPAPTVYSGYATVALAQRIMSAGHGGQILLSGATGALLQDALPDSSILVDLGPKRLKDSLRPERLFQLNVAGLMTEFPPLKTLDARPNNLPAQLTTFIGRERQINEVRQLLRKHRLVTLTGSGGTGKTRLSLEAAAGMLEDFEHGLWFIEMAPISDPETLPNTILAEMRVSVQTGGAPLDILREYLHDRCVLLVLDNCEHLIESTAALVLKLLNAAPKLKILASSREALGLNGEISYTVPSLSMPAASHPSDLDELTRCEAVELFLDRARLVAPDFELSEANAPHVVQICRRLDGIPLAIELAAARVRMMSVEQIAARLDDRFRLLTGGARTALPRQQTLRALIDWSYEILSDNERLLLCSFSVFAGSWTLEAAEEVCVDEHLDRYQVLELLAQLVNKSLVAASEEMPEGGSRYHMLETIRQYAREKLLHEGGAEAVRDRHLRYYPEVVRNGEPEFFGPMEMEWMNWLRSEADNLHAAVEWSLQSQADAGLELVNRLGYFLLDHFGSRDLERWLPQLMSHPLNAAAGPRRAHRLIIWAWSLCLGSEELARGQALLEEALSIYRDLGDRNGMAHAYHAHGLLRFSLGAAREGIPFLEQALDLFRETSDKVWIAHTLQFIGFSLGVQEAGRKIACLDESLELYRQLGYISGIIEVLKQLGATETRLGNFERAHAWLEEGRSYLQQHASSLGRSKTLSYDLGDLAFHEGRHETAREHYEDALAWAEQVVSPVSVGYASLRLGLLCVRTGELGVARGCLSRALEVFGRVGSASGMIQTLEGAASLAVACGAWERAALLLAHATSRRDSEQDPAPIVEQGPRERDRDRIRAELDQQDFDRLWEQGGALTSDQALALALEE